MGDALPCDLQDEVEDSHDDEDDLYVIRCNKMAENVERLQMAFNSTKWFRDTQRVQNRAKRPSWWVNENSHEEFEGSLEIITMTKMITKKMIRLTMKIMPEPKERDLYPRPGFSHTPATR